jgi:hypothetical protein
MPADFAAMANFAEKMNKGALRENLDLACEYGLELEAENHELRRLLDSSFPIYKNLSRNGLI